MLLIFDIGSLVYNIARVHELALVDTMECYKGGIAMKKLLIIALAALFLAGCSPAVETEAKMYIVPGHYYTSGKVVTLDGNVWDYSQDIISEAPSYDNEPVFALFYDAKTPDYIYDDEIVGLVLNDGNFARCP